MSLKIISGVKWVAVERFSNQFIQFGVSVVIARFITPSEYGILGILLVFINIAQVFVDSGLGSALIYFNKLDKDDINTTFVFNLILSLVLGSIIYMIAPFVESFYNISGLSTFLRISLIVLLSNSIIVVPTAILKIQLDFKVLSTSNLIANINSAILGIYCAVQGYGVWALIIQALSKSIITAILLFLQCKWHPAIYFSKKSFFKLYKYGINIFSTSIITRFTDEGIATVIAKFLTPYNLGLYSRSGQFATFPSSCIGNIVSTTIFPALSSMRNDKERYNRLYNSSIKLQSFLVIPLYVFMAVEAKPLILILLTDKWIDLVPIFPILCIGRVFALLANTTEQNLNASGYSRLCLKQQVYKLLLKIVLVLIALPFGIIAVALADAIQTLSQFFITAFVARKAIGYTVYDQFKICVPYLIASIIAGFVIYLCINLFNNVIIQLLIPGLVGMVLYISIILIVFKDQEPLQLIRKFL